MVSSELQIVLNEISGLRTDVKEDQKRIWEAIEEDREKHHQLDLKVEKIKVEKKMTEDAFIRHIQNKNKHFKTGFKETTGQKIKRKKKEYTLVGVVITTICSAITIIVNHYFG